MKISLNMAQRHSNVDLTKIGVPKLLEKIGAQLGAIDEVSYLDEKYKGIIVAKVVTCERHPDADKLHVCMIDDGGAAKQVKRDGKGLVQVVCGAPNVRAGMFVAWLPPGTTVPSTYDKEPFVLEAKELRGMVSNGMLASASELAISDDHSGLLELNPHDTKPGADFAEVYQLNDVIIDVENKMFTHRPDCFGLIGVARELAAIQGLAYESEAWYLKQPHFDMANELKLKVEVQDKKLVPRFMAVTMAVNSNSPSPAWLQSCLSRIGIRPISTIVDITNFIMVLTGQPMHAYDADKLRQVAGGKEQLVRLEARKSVKGEKLKLLNGKVVTLEDDSTIMISSNGVPVGIGGVMGGAGTEVDEHTKNIVLEAASFNMYSIRRTSMKYGLFTDAVTRFNKGQSPLQNDRAMAYAIEQVKRLAEGRVTGTMQDIHGNLEEPASIAVTAPFINERLGAKLSLKEIAKLLENAEFTIKTVPADKSRLHVKPPFWRTDIEIPEDIVEEVGRLYGYDHLPLELPKRDITPAPKDAMLELKNKVRDILADAGANEVLTYSFVHGDLLDKCGQDKKHAFKLSNALSPDLQYYRTGLTPSLLDKVRLNIKAGYDVFALFEINKVHYKDEWEEAEPDVPLEDNHLALVTAAADTGSQSGAAYYQARKYLEQVVPGVKLMPLDKFDLDKDEWGKQLTAPYEPKRSAVIVKDDEIWGVVGEFRSAVKRALKLPAFTSGFELNLGIVDTEPQSYTPLPRFPKVEQDVSLAVPENVAFAEIQNLLEVKLEELKPENSYMALSALDIFKPEDAAIKHVTFRLTIASYQKTLVAEEVNKLLDDAATAAHEVFGAERL